jgi:SlyX protein
MNKMDEERLINIEIKIAYQEDLIEELNNTIYQQQQQIDRLQTACQSLANNLQSLTESGNEISPGNEAPPHY